MITATQRQSVVEKTTLETPLGHTHWSVRTMAKATGLGATTIREIWRAHGYKRHGTTTPFAALNMADGTVISTCQDRPRHQESLKFLKLIDAALPRREPCT